MNISTRERVRWALLLWCSLSISSLRRVNINLDSPSTEVIRPWIRGREVKRWHLDWEGLYVLFTRRGIDIDAYPAVRDHLLNFKTRLMPGVPGGRKPGTYQWFEIQDAIDYHEEFAKPKIVFQEIATYQAFAFSRQPVLCNNKCFFIPRDDLYLLAILNSKAAWFFLGNVASKLQGGAFAMQSPFVGQIPVPFVDTLQQTRAAKIAEKLVNAGAAHTQDAMLEQELNALVYELYELTEDEIAIVEGRA